jgi:hypothetical protein
MSLTATLLGVPGLVKKLRGHNAPATPLGLPGAVELVSGSNSNLPSAYATWKPALRTHQTLDHASLNNSTSLVIPVASLTGKGALDGVWVKTTLAASVLSTCTYDVQIIVDGVDITPTAYSHAMSATQTSTYFYAALSAAVGGASIIKAHLDSNLGLSTCPIFERASVPIPFNSSLVVNLVHVSSTSAAYRTSCWVNAWLNA